MRCRAVPRRSAPRRAARGPARPNEFEGDRALSRPIGGVLVEKRAISFEFVHAHSPGPATGCGGSAVGEVAGETVEGGGEGAYEALLVLQGREFALTAHSRDGGEEQLGVATGERRHEP